MYERIIYYNQIEFIPGKQTVVIFKLVLFSTFKEEKSMIISTEAKEAFDQFQCCL